MVRLPTATLLTTCALSAALLVAGRGGTGERVTMPGTDAVLPAAEGRVVSGDPLGDLTADPPAAHQDSGSYAGTDDDAGSGVEPGPGAVDPGPGGAGLGSDFDRGVNPDEIGPETVPEIPDLPDGGGLIPDGPDGGGLIPDGPDESGALDPSDSIFGSPVDVLMG